MYKTANTPTRPKRSKSAATIRVFLRIPSTKTPAKGCTQMLGNLLSANTTADQLALPVMA